MDLSNFYKIMYKQFSTLKTKLDDVNKAAAMISSSSNSSDNGLALYQIYKANVDAFREFYKAGSAATDKISYEKYAIGVARRKAEGGRLAKAYGILEEIRAEEEAYLKDLKRLEREINSLGESCRKDKPHIFFSGLREMFGSLHKIGANFNEPVVSAIQACCNNEDDDEEVAGSVAGGAGDSGNILGCLESMCGAVCEWIRPFMENCLPFIENYADTLRVFKESSNEMTADKYAKEMLRPYYHFQKFAGLMESLAEIIPANTAANIKVREGMYKLRDCKVRLEEARKYSGRIEKLFEFEKVVSQYKIKENFFLDGTRELVYECLSCSFTITAITNSTNNNNNNMNADTFEPHVKHSNVTVYLFNNCLLVCSKKLKDYKQIKINEVDIDTNGPSDSVTLRHENNDFTVVVSDLKKELGTFKEKIEQVINSAKMTRVFGADLAQLARNSRSSTKDVPLVIDEAIKFLSLESSLRVEGIVRRAPKYMELDRLIQAADNGYPVYFSDPLLTWGFLKRWLMQIPGSLLVAAKRAEWKSAGSDIAKCLDVLRSIDKPNVAVFCALIGLSVEVIKREKDNRMNKGGLITCLQMTLLGDMVMQDNGVQGCILSVFLDNPSALNGLVAGRNMQQIKQRTYAPLAPRRLTLTSASPPMKLITAIPAVPPVANNGDNNNSESSENSNSSSSSSSSSDGDASTIAMQPPSPLFSHQAINQLPQDQQSPLLLNLVNKPTSLSISFHLAPPSAPAPVPPSPPQPLQSAQHQQPQLNTPPSRPSFAVDEPIKFNFAPPPSK